MILIQDFLNTMENNPQILSQDERMLLDTFQRFGLWKCGLANGTPLTFYADSVMDDLLGIYEEVTPEERARIYAERIYPADMDIVLEYTKQLKNSPTEVEYRYIHPRWGVRMVRCFGKLLGEKDGMTYTIGRHWDITDNVHLRYQTEQTDHTMAALTKRLYGFNLTVDIFTGEYRLIKGTGMQEVLSEMERYVDYKVIVNRLNKTIHPDYLQRYMDIFSFDNIKQMAGMKGYIRSFEMPVRYTDEGDYQWHELTLFIDADEHDEPVVNILGRDVTQAHRQAEAESQLAIAKAANKAKTNFLFNMSHDIRTPMNAIMGFTDLLPKHLDDKELARNYLHKIQTSNEFLLSLINNVLEMARIESGKTTLDEQLMDFDEFHDTLNAVFEPQMQQKGITFTRTAEIEHMNILCDVTKLREIYLNILSNALKYTPRGGKVTMHTIELPSNRPDQVVFQCRVSDTGIGMSPDFLPHLFEEFTRERTSTESRVIGTGLGMPIVKHLVELMKGTIQVESELGKGTTFIVTIPHSLVQEEEQRPTSSPASKPDYTLFLGRRVLIAEDNDLNAEISEAILGEVGFLTERAVDGQECVEKLRQAAPDYYALILMDIQMPRMDGYEATRHIRQFPDPAKAHIPIVAMTANAFYEDRGNAIMAGMDGHLSKPIERKKMMLMLTELLRR